MVLPKSNLPADSLVSNIVSFENEITNSILTLKLPISQKF